MKRNTYLLIAAAILCGCSNGDDTASKPSVGFGSVAIVSQTEANVQTVETRATSTYEIPSDLIPSADDLTLYITGTYIETEGGEEMSYDEVFESVTAYNSAEGEGVPPTLNCGDYEATVSNGGDTSVESETNACFASEAVSFEVEPDVFTGSVSIEAKLQNSIIKLSCGEWFMSYFSSASFTVTTSNGNEFTFDPFSADNDNRIIFVAPDSELTLSGSATKEAGGEITFSQSVIGTAKAGYMNSINIESESVGNLVVSVTLNDDIVEIHEEEIDLNTVID